MLNMKLSNGPINPAAGAEIPGDTLIMRRGNSMLPNAPISLSYANFPREQGTRIAKRSAGLMTRPRLAKKKI